LSPPRREPESQGRGLGRAARLGQCLPSVCRGAVSGAQRLRATSNWPHSCLSLTFMAARTVRSGGQQGSSTLALVCSAPKLLTYRLAVAEVAPSRLAATKCVLLATRAAPSGRRRRSTVARNVQPVGAPNGSYHSSLGAHLACSQSSLSAPPSWRKMRAWRLSGSCGPSLPPSEDCPAAAWTVVLCPRQSRRLPSAGTPSISRRPLAPSDHEGRPIINPMEATRATRKQPPLASCRLCLCLKWRPSSWATVDTKLAVGELSAWAKWRLVQLEPSDLRPERESCNLNPFQLGQYRI